MAEPSKVSVDEPAPGVARIKLSNPDKRGALDHGLLDALAEAIRSLDDARCLIVTGDGKVFSSGYDLSGLQNRGASFVDIAEGLLGYPFNDSLLALEEYAYPTIAAINGHAIGGGLELAITCDIRIAARDAKFGIPPGKLGVVYPHTGVRKFIQVCGVAQTSELMLVGDTFGADRAKEMGLLNRIVDPDEVGAMAVGLAQEITRNAPLSLRANKQIIRALRNESSRLPEEVERELLELRDSCFASHDLREGVQAFGEKRTPTWQDS